MILLPRGNSVKEKVNPGKVNLPEALDKLRQGKFTGYLRFDFPVGTGIFIFEGGRFIDALFESAHDSLLARTAISRIFSESIKANGSLSIYRLSTELSLQLHALLCGDLLHQGQELELINVRGLLKRLRDEKLNGCLRVYAGERIALIFYRDGKPIGFFHDGSAELETTADCSRSVAGEAGAKIDVLATHEPSGQSLADLWETDNLVELWQAALSEKPGGGVAAPVVAVRSVELPAGERQNLLLGMLRKVAQQYLGAFGASLAEKEFAGIAQGPLDEARLTAFYTNLALAAELVIEADKVEKMLAEMKQGVRALLATR
jgi:hypothetical protein